LTRLLDHLARLDWSEQLQVVVVDNDEAQEGIEVCQRIAKTYRWPLTYRHEAQRGISFARNHAISLALDLDPDLVAMLDDDEWPARDWLTRLREVQLKTGADVVGGPVIPSFPPDTGAWVEKVKGCYGAVREIEDGEECILYATGNFLASAACFRALSPQYFRHDFALSGGEDYVFFRSLRERGFKTHWSARALAWEEVPRVRLDRDWVRRHMILKGNIQIRMYRVFEPGALHEAWRWSKTVGLLGYGIVEYLREMLSGRDRVEALLILWRAQGKVMAHLGYTLTRQGKIEGI
jgi:glycosyltransferase involved in cell wall biosynthesis